MKNLLKITSKIALCLLCFTFIILENLSFKHKLYNPKNNISQEVSAKISEDSYDLLRKKWAATLIPLDMNIDIYDKVIKGSIDSIVKNADSLWKTMNKEYNKNFLWSNASSTTDPSHISLSYRNILEMSKAFVIKGSYLKGNKELLKDITYALDWMNEKLYNSSNYYGNWWEWEIGSPQLLNNILVLLYDYLPYEKIKEYTATTKAYVSSPYKLWKGQYEATGANRVDLCKVIALRAILTKDPWELNIAKNALKPVLQLVTKGDGFYEDGSFIQHGNIPYTGTYGAVLLEGMGEILYLLKDSNWALDQSDVNSLYKLIKKSFEPLIYKGLLMDMVNGRAISRGIEDFGYGVGVISPLLLYYIPSMPQVTGDYYRALIKNVIIANKYRDIKAFTTNLNFKIEVKKLSKNITLNPIKELTGTFNFANMDRFLHRREDYAFGISMYSERTGAYEGNMNGENLKGFHTGDGMTYLYNDLEQFAGGFWPTVDPYRLPGTTIDTRRLKAGDGTALASPESWVGGTVLDSVYGAAGMHLNKLSPQGKNVLGMDLKAKKSWFMFDNEIVALGSNVSSSSENPIETIIENRKILDNNQNQFIVDGIKQSNALGKSYNMQGVSWAHLSGNSPGTDIGYYFPNKYNINIKREARTGSWQDINSSKSKDSITKNYLTLWLNHGIKPYDSKYAYVLLPNSTKEQTEDYAKNPDIRILANDSNVHAVKENRLNIIGANFWNDKVHKMDIITVDKKASIMVREAFGYTEVSISDPTMKNKGFITVEIDKISKGILSTDDNIEVIQIFPTTKFKVNVNNARGKSFNVRFKTS